MDGDDGRPGIRGGAGVRRRTRIRRVGEPNVLSDAAIPNTLSGMVSRPANTTPSSRPATAGPSTGRPGTGETTSRRRGLPSFGTLIFLAFLAFTGFRLIGEFVREFDLTPTETSAANQAIVPGSVIFGSTSDGDCGVLETAHEFVAGTDVWWSARLSSEQGPDAEVVVIVRRDGAEVDREAVPPDESFGTWSVLCSGGPVSEKATGLYRVEVWDAAITTQLAIGEYRLTPG